ncbi:MAG: DUF5916 domain-containing protein [Calditrichia bacterium]
MKNFYHLLFLLLVLSNVQADAHNIRRYTARHINPHPPVIDGLHTDVVWHKAQEGNGFRQYDPVEGAEPSQQTTFRIMYDQENIYVFITAYDDEPQKIVSRLSRRDQAEASDLAGVIIDSRHDHRTAYEFSVNPANVKEDAIYMDDSFNADANWDPVWESSTLITDSGWTAEMRIPLSQLRFSGNPEQIWGLQVYRYIHRQQELDYWQPISKSAGGYVSNFGEISGISGIKAPRRIELLPYSVSRLQTFEKDAGNPFGENRDYDVTGGIDGKIGINGNLTLDFTVNPDFGQVEADPSEVNLTAFETFFQEKRPFFVEGKSIFSYNLAFGDGDMSRETLFYSRRIGRRPHHEPDVDDDAFVEQPENTSIIGAAKLSGRTGNGWSIGLLDATTASEEARISLYGLNRSEEVEPLTNYFVGRLQKDMNKGATTFGAIATATNRRIDAEHLNFLNTAAYSGGGDLTHWWKDRSYFLETKLAFSHIRGHQDAMLEAQTSSVRYYQRPDASHLKVDSSRTSLSGYAGSFTIGRLGNSNWRYAVGATWRSPGFEVNDLGYVQQSDKIMQFVWVGYRYYEPLAFFRQLWLNFNQWEGWNFAGENRFGGGNINGGAQFNNYWRFQWGINRQLSGLSASELRGGPSLRYEGGWNNWLGIYSDSRKSWQLSFYNYNNWSDDGISAYHQYSLEMLLKPANQFNISAEPFYYSRTSNLQYVDTFEEPAADRYLMGLLDQKTLGVVFRFNLSISPELTIQYYGQPFISVGDYSSYKYITDPRSKQYQGRFQDYSDQQVSYDAAAEEYVVDENRDGSEDYRFEQPDFNFRQFRSNLVIRWEYYPGSQIYLVWSQGRTGSSSDPDFSLNRGMDQLFSIHPDNVFLIKLNHWFSL